MAQHHVGRKLNKSGFYETQYPEPSAVYTWVKLEDVKAAYRDLEDQCEELAYKRPCSLTPGDWDPQEYREHYLSAAIRHSRALLGCGECLVIKQCARIAHLDGGIYGVIAGKIRKAPR